MVAVRSLGVLAFVRFIAAAIAVGVLAGCPHLQLLAEYDAKCFEETIRIGKSVDVFYGRMLEVPAEKRAYKQFADGYVEIEADIRSLVQRNAARALNSESLRISKIILGFWVEYRKNHQKSDRYGDARFDRMRFNRLFTAAAAAEEAKNLKAGDGEQKKTDDE